jgi:hypothetical protein
MQNTRSAKILSYLRDWRGGYWNLQTDNGTGVPEKVADEVIAWHDLQESAANRKAYADEFLTMARAEDVIYEAAHDGILFIEVPTAPEPVAEIDRIAAEDRQHWADKMEAEEANDGYHWM